MMSRSDPATKAISYISSQKMKNVVGVVILFSFCMCTRAMGIFMEKQSWKESLETSNRLVVDSQSNDYMDGLSRKTSLLQSTGGGTSHASRVLDIDTTPSAEMPLLPVRTTTTLGEDFAVEIEQVMESLKDKSDETRIQTMLVHTADMSVLVSIDKKVTFQEKLDDIVKDIGKGYYQQRNFHSESNQMDDSHSESLEVTVRVLHENFEKVISSIRRIADSVNYVNSNSYDVADDFIDAMARSAVSDALRSSLQTLMRKAQTVEEILMLQREINRLLEEAESQRQRAKRLQDQSKYSTLTVHIRFYKQQINSNFSAIWNPFSAMKSALHDVGILFISVAYGLVYIFFWLLPFFLIFLCIGFYHSNDPEYTRPQFSPKDPSESKSVV